MACAPLVLSCVTTENKIKLSQEFTKIGTALESYYTQNGGLYRDNNGVGLFEKFVTTQGLHECPIEHQLGKRCKPGDSVYVEFSTNLDDFPLPHGLIVSNNDMQDYIFYILQHCYLRNGPPTIDYIKEHIIPKLQDPITGNEYWRNYKAQPEAHSNDTPSSGLAQYSKVINFAETLMSTIDGTKWCSVKQTDSFKQGKTIKLSKNEWVEICKKTFERGALPLFPVVAKKKKKYWIEWIQTIYIKSEDVYVGISCKCIDEKWFVQSINLDQVDIYNRHRSSGLIGNKYTEQLKQFNTSIKRIIFTDNTANDTDEKETVSKITNHDSVCLKRKIPKTNQDKKNGAKGNIYISTEMTENIIPHMVETTLSPKELYDFMDGSTYLQTFNHSDGSTDEYNTGQLRILNYDFYDKNTNEILYCVADKNDATKGYQWKMRDYLYTVKELNDIICISDKLLPQSSRQKPSFIHQLKYQDEIENLIKNDFDEIVDETPWNEIPIFNQKSNKKRITLCLTIDEFKNELKKYVSNTHCNIKPIVILDKNGRYHIEYVLFVKICNHYIYISSVYNQKQLKASHIYLNIQFIQKQYQLISLLNDGHSLNDYKPNIDVLEIGEPNTKQKQLNYYKQRSKKLTQCIQKFVCDINGKNVSNPNINIMSKLVENGKKVITNERNLGITSDSHTFWSNFLSNFI